MKIHISCQDAHLMWRYTSLSRCTSQVEIPWVWADQILCWPSLEQHWNLYNHISSNVDGNDGVPWQSTMAISLSLIHLLFWNIWYFLVQYKHYHQNRYSLKVGNDRHTEKKTWYLLTIPVESSLYWVNLPM